MGTAASRIYSGRTETRQPHSGAIADWFGPTDNGEGRDLSSDRKKRKICDYHRNCSRREPWLILIVLGVSLDLVSHFFLLSLSLHALGCASGVNETQSSKFALSNNLFNPTNRRPGPLASVGRKDGGLFSFAFWLFMSISVTSFTQSSSPPPLYAILGARSMVYATICFVAVLVFG